MVRMARAYRFGKGVDTDHNTAVQWYIESIKNGYDCSNELINYLLDLSAESNEILDRILDQLCNENKTREYLKIYAIINYYLKKE